MPSRKSDARRSDVSPAVADASSPTARADSSVPSTSPPPRAEEGEENSTTEGTKRGKEAAAAAVDLDKMTIEDLTLPKSIITRLAKGVLPANTQIQANAIMAMSKSATVFISYLAAHANEITLNANKKTIMPADVFKALEIIEFDFLKEPLQAEFAKFNAIQTDKRNTYRQKVKAAVKTPGDDVEMGGGAGVGGSEDRGVGDKTTTSALSDGDDAPRSKKARVEASPADAEETDAEDPEEEDAAEEMDDEEEDEEEQEDEEEEEHRQDSGDETQDTLEEMADVEQEDADEAMDGDESD
ncbi:CBF/NF-Y family transcription factor, putative [Cordyceps militaris CM01]|uniref:DNA polymerase epsilon subunit D n=1 Tax=Cordyceps militaris (strain CM01) TaxID=983644 RepID=G3JLM0_CORMM|nr:CBF/NF-Y family transcription factor, putative [Cordyceps militaris CM01]EGX90594.1 CBF/NF-Y family transcription factor, putative [Cordyceps militaris CM01]